MKRELSKLITVYEAKIITKQDFRNPIMVSDEWGNLPNIPHSIDSMRSLEREWTYKEVVEDLKVLIK